MTLPQVVLSSRPLRLERLIGKGGEGEVYSINGDPNHAVKIYTTADRLIRHEKVAAMVRSDLAKRSTLAAFPEAVVQFKDGSFAGFVMRLVEGHKPLHELYAPGPRKNHFPQADYRFLARSATNIARAFHSIHSTNCVVGDINHSGILISSKATATLIDADSFQFLDGQRRFLCRVGVPEYTPPELQGKPLNGVIRTTDHDAFGLAVVIFQVLLMGRHPFVGAVRKGEIPPLHENVETFRYVYTEGRDVGMDQPPGTPSLSDFAPEIAKLFDQAFSKNSVGSRPSAANWVDTLERFELTLAQCSDNPLHFGPKGASECAWCEMDRMLGTFLFLPYLPGSPSQPKVDPGSAGFDLGALWSRIERVYIPTSEQLQPQKTVVAQPPPSEAARLAKEVKIPSGSASGILLIVGAVFIFLVEPKAWIVALPLAGFGVSKLRAKTSQPAIDESPFKNAFVDAQNQWYRELEGWRRRVGHIEIVVLKEKLRTARQQYIEAKADEQRMVEGYKSRRKENQLQVYLGAFDLSRANIKGIGPAKLAALASYGIDTAAHITQSRLEIVPGFGEAMIGRLLTWRKGHEARFVYNSANNDLDRQEMARIASLIEAKVAPLRGTLKGGAMELEQRAQKVRDFAQREDPALVKVRSRLNQARVDLEFLGFPVPHISPPSQTRATPTPFAQNPPPQPIRTPPTSTLVGRAPTCPRCGSNMHQRLARRGRNAGNYFWGCSRYPSCKGTRPI